MISLDYSSLADLMSSNTPAEGVEISAGGFRYIVAAESAMDYHIQTASGLKLYVKPGEKGYNILAFGAKPDASEDISTILQKAVNASSDVPIYCPAGKYLWDGSGIDITGRSSFSLTGDNAQGYSDATVFHCNGLAEYNIDIQSAPTLDCPVSISGVSFDGTNGIDGNFSTVWPGVLRNQKPHGPHRLRLNKVSIQGSGLANAAALDLRAFWWVEIKDCELSRFVNGWLLKSERATTFNVDKTYFHYAREILNLGGTSAYKFSNCVFEASVTVGCFNFSRVKFVDCHFEHIGYSITGSHTTGISDKNKREPTGEQIDTWFNLQNASVIIDGGVLYESWAWSPLKGIFRLIPDNVPATYQRGGYVELRNPMMNWLQTIPDPFGNLFVQSEVSRGNEYTIRADFSSANFDSSNYPFILTAENLRRVHEGSIILHYPNGNIQRQADIKNGKLRIHCFDLAGEQLAKSPYMIPLAAGDAIINHENCKEHIVHSAVETKTTVAFDLSESQDISVESTAGISVGNKVTISNADNRTSFGHICSTVSDVPDANTITLTATSGAVSVPGAVVSVFTTIEA